MRARAGRRTRSVRARTGRKASSLDPCRESDFLSTIFLILIAQTTLGPIAGPETLPFPETSKKRPCCLCSRSAGARSIQGPCQRLVARNWPGSIGYAGAVCLRERDRPAWLQENSGSVAVRRRRRRRCPACARTVGSHGFPVREGSVGDSGSLVTAPESLRPQTRPDRTCRWPPCAWVGDEYSLRFAVTAKLLPPCAPRTPI